jgi:hypothetical protein
VESERLSWQELRLWPPPRRVGAALSFGVAFVVFGTAGLVRALGVHFASFWFYPLALCAIGVAGLVSVLLRQRT